MVGMNYIGVGNYLCLSLLLTIPLTFKKPSTIKTYKTLSIPHTIPKSISIYLLYFMYPNWATHKTWTTQEILLKIGPNRSPEWRKDLGGITPGTIAEGKAVPSLKQTNKLINTKSKVSQS